MRQLCAAGYYGPVCSLCVTSGHQRYGRVGSLQCKPCRSTAAIIGAYVASALGVLAWLSYTIHVTLVENEEAAAGHDDPQRTSQLIRVCFVHFFGRFVDRTDFFVREKVCVEVDCLELHFGSGVLA